MKNKSRLRRRHDDIRVKGRAERIFWWNPSYARKVANNLQVCSNYCCGNQRKHEGPTRKENANRLEASMESNIG